MYGTRLIFKELPVDAGRIRSVKNDSVIDCIGIFNKCMHKQNVSKTENERNRITGNKKGEREKNQEGIIKFITFHEI